MSRDSDLCLSDDPLENLDKQIANLKSTLLLEIPYCPKLFSAFVLALLEASANDM